MVSVVMCLPEEDLWTLITDGILSEYSVNREKSNETHS